MLLLAFGVCCCLKITVNNNVCCGESFGRFGAGFVGEGVPPNTSNPSAKPTAKASAKATNAYYQKQPQAHNSQQPLNQSQVLH